MEASEKDTKLGAVDPHHSTTGDEQEDTPSGSQEDDAETKAGKKRKRAPSISSEGDAASSLNERWEEMFGRLKAFRERYGHCNGKLHVHLVWALLASKIPYFSKKKRPLALPT